MSVVLDNRVMEDQPEAQCPFGDMEHHLAFTLLNLAALRWFFSSLPHTTPTVPKYLLGAGTSFSVGYHVLLGGVCQSSRLSSAFLTHLTTCPLINMTINTLVVSGVAAHFVARNSNGPRRAAKLVFLFLAALVSALALGWWWTHDLSNLIDHGITLRASALSTTTLLILSLAFIYSSTKSRALALSLISLPVGLMTMSALNLAFPLDQIGRLAASPGSDAQSPHWSVTLRSIIVNTITVLIRTVTAYTVFALQPRSRAVPMELTSSVSLKLKASEWLFVSAFVGFAAITIQSWLWSLKWSLSWSAWAAFSKQVAPHHARDLLSVRPKQFVFSRAEGVDMWFLAGCGSTLFLALILVAGHVSGGIRKLRRSCCSRCCPSQSKLERVRSWLRSNLPFMGTALETLSAEPSITWPPPEMESDTAEAAATAGKGGGSSDGGIGGEGGSSPDERDGGGGMAPSGCNGSKGSTEQPDLAAHTQHGTSVADTHGAVCASPTSFPDAQSPSLPRSAEPTESTEILGDPTRPALPLFAPLTESKSSRITGPLGHILPKECVTTIA